MKLLPIIISFLTLSSASTAMANNGIEKEDKQKAVKVEQTQSFLSIAGAQQQWLENTTPKKKVRKSSYTTSFTHQATAMIARSLNERSN